MENQNYWEDIYKAGAQLNRYPYDFVVTFIYRYFPRSKAREDIKILEIGSGAGNNLWFAAREGFSVTGIDISESAITFSRNRFKEEKLPGEFLVGDFTKIGFKNEFDIVLDRGSLSCVSYRQIQDSFDKIHTALSESGTFIFNGYSSEHASASCGEKSGDGLTKNITGGPLQGLNQLCFLDKEQVGALFPEEKWNIVEMQHVRSEDLLGSDVDDANKKTHAEWRIVAQKIG